MNKILRALIIASIIFNALLPAGAESADEAKNRLGHLFDLYMTEAFVMLRDESLHEKIQMVVRRIVSVTDKPSSSMRLRIINERLPIAASFPGYVYVSSGMLDILESESELAFVITHAMTHTMKNDQKELYDLALRKNQRDKLTVYSMPLVLLTGAAAAELTIMQGIATSGIYSTSVYAYASSAPDNIQKANIHNLFIPYIDLSDIEQSLSAMVFLNDVYIGYGEEDEIQADNMTITYLAKAGYDTAAIVPLLEKLKKSRDDHIANGDAAHLLLCNPGLEKRIDNARHVLEN